MKIIDGDLKKIVEGVFNQPTAPFREEWVLRHVKSQLEKLKMPYATDKWGNIYAGVSKVSKLKSTNRLALVAHTDHPGFHLIKTLKKTNTSETWQAKWFGGFPPKPKDSKVAIYHPKHPGLVSVGKIISTKIPPKDRLFEIKVDSKAMKFSLKKSCFGAFNFPGFQLKGTRINTRCADDLAGVSIILGTISKLSKKERKNFLGIFTRSEEVGFVGAMALLEGRILGPKNSVISLEASKQLPQARIGKGPVIRLGDRSTLFSSGVTKRLDMAANKLALASKSFCTQRRILPGGSCEATAFNLYKIPAGGLALPLGNYHNQKSDGTPGPEIIDIRDYQRAVHLCVRVYQDMTRQKEPMEVMMKNLKKNFKNYSKFYKGVPKFETKVKK